MAVRESRPNVAGFPARSIARSMTAVAMIELVCDWLVGKENLVEPSGIEPLTSCMPCRRSPS